MKLYHYQVFLKKEHKKVICKVPLSYTNHAIERIRDKNIDIKKIPKIIPSDAFVIEVGELNHTITKQVVRIGYDDVNDLVLSVTPTGYVITLWLNEISDNHITLNKSKYARM